MMDSHWEGMRQSMVETQLRARGICDTGVLRAMETIPRHEFVPPDERFRSYDDCPLPIGLSQTISQPYIVGYMTELLEVAPEHKVLEVGTGSGYQAAILAALAGEVFTIDIHSPLIEAARTRLASLGIQNVQFDLRNGHLGWPEAAPFDRIMVTAGGTFIPQPLIDQLAPHGRMVIPVGPAGDDQVLKLITRQDAFRVDIRDTVPVRFVPLVREERGGTGQ
jgi:protein-L-isoaspartate(D-aspartate) O-methyltransferase